jgi:hypothetical protein
LSALLAAPLLAMRAAAACTGDCNGDGRVSIAEQMLGIDIALRRAALVGCPSFDANGNGVVAINELIAAVNDAIGGCPPDATPTAQHSTPTPLPTDTPSATPTATVNHPPALPTPSIYRAYPGFEIRLPIGAVDPEGRAVHCSTLGLPAGASFDESSGVLRWTPAADQLGPFYVAFTCADDFVPPASASGQLVVDVAPLDACGVPSCDPAIGCTTALPPLDDSCCAGGAGPRVAEPDAGCPAGRVLFVGQNADSHTFGRLQNCDVMTVKNFQQSGAEVQLHVEMRCVNTRNPVRLHARMESNAEFHPVLFDVVTRKFVPSNDADGFARQRGLRFAIGGGGPFFDIQDAEANLYLTLTDEDGTSVSDEVRVRLSFTPQPDRPDVDPTPIAE